jgi:hypothetical protein
VGDPEHDRFSRSVFHAVSKPTHFLTPLTPMIGIIDKQAWRWVTIRHCDGSEAQEILPPNLAHSEGKDSVCPAVICRHLRFRILRLDIIFSKVKKGGNCGLDNPCFS